MKGASQGDPVPAYVFNLALEVLFILIKSSESINGILYFKHVLLYSVYADGCTFLETFYQLKNLPIVSTSFIIPQV